MLRPHFPTHIMSGYQVGAPLGVASCLTFPWPSPGGRWGLDSRLRGNDGNDRHYIYPPPVRARWAL